MHRAKQVSTSILALAKSVETVARLRKILTPELIDRTAQADPGAARLLLEHELYTAFGQLLGEPAADLEQLTPLIGSDKVVELYQLAQENPQPPGDKKSIHIASSTMAPGVCYIVANLWGLGGRRYVASAYSRTSVTSAQAWKDHWTNYLSITKSLLERPVPWYTWNALISQGVQLRQPLSLEIRSEGGDDHPLGGGIVLPAGSALLAPPPENLLTLEHDDIIKQLQTFEGAANHEFEGDALEKQHGKQDSLSLVKAQDILMHCCQDKGSTTATLAAVGIQILSALGIPLSLPALSVLVRSLHWYFLHPWGAVAFYSFPSALFSKHEKHTIAGVLSLASKAPLALEQRALLEVAAHRLLTPYVHSLVNNYTASRNATFASLARESGVNSITVATTLLRACEYLEGAIGGCKSVWGRIWPVQHIQSINAVAVDGKAKVLFKKAVVQMLMHKGYTSFRDLAVLCGLVNKSLRPLDQNPQRRSSLLMEFLGMTSQNHCDVDQWKRVVTTLCKWQEVSNIPGSSPLDGQLDQCQNYDQCQDLAARWTDDLRRASLLPATREFKPEQLGRMLGTLNKENARSLPPRDNLLLEALLQPIVSTMHAWEDVEVAM